MTVHQLAKREYPCMVECSPPNAPKYGMCPTCHVSKCRTAFVLGITKQGERAKEQFDEAITQLVLDYGITDEVAESYCLKFNKALY